MPHALTISSREMSGQDMPPMPAWNSAMALWYWAPPKSRMCAFGSLVSSMPIGLPSGPMKAPPRMCSSVSVSPNLSGGAETVPLSSSPSFEMNDSLKILPFSLSFSASRSFSSPCVSSSFWLALLNSRSSTGTIVGTFSRYRRWRRCSRNRLSWPTPMRARSARSSRLPRRASSSATSRASRSATASLKCSLDLKMASRELPTLPEGTDEKKGEPPSIVGSSSRDGGLRNISTSWGLANCGMRVSSLVETTTVLRRVGSTAMTRRLVVALDQSFESSRQRMMYSFCSILARTMASTWRELFCSPALRLPGAAEMSPGVSMMVRLGQYLYSMRTTISLDQNWPSRSRRAFSLSM
mmetsp:Transcript_10581/g.29131  ORF Transcript_10581/g.29131 Transcript_10581/m.29131 type:complete len:353 (+) Transcript_10581:889-1947(+)